MQNIAFIPLLLNDTSGFIHPLNWPAQPDVLSSALPHMPVLVHICLLWLGAIQSWRAAYGFPLHYQSNPVLSASTTPLGILIPMWFWPSERWAINY